MIIEINTSLTAANEATAAQVRQELKDKGIFCLNLVSAPGSGKTSLIEKTIQELGPTLRIAVIEGDPHTALDSHRVEDLGVTAIQINTQGGCHLDAAMIKKALKSLNTSEIDLLIIENVGNLLCPTFWDLGENVRVVMASLPEGADKPQKYPEIYSLSDALVINKIDLEGILRTTTEDIRQAALLINKQLSIFPLSCETGKGMQAWCEWTRAQLKNL